MSTQAGQVRVRSIEVPLALQGASDLEHPDWADAFAARIPTGAPQEAAYWHDAVLRTSAPRWLDGLVRARGVLARALRLDTAHGDPELWFPVLFRTDDLLVCGADDRHLDFRVVLAVVAGAHGGADVVLVTFVQRHNAVGRAYFTLVRPFHRLIVPALLRRAVRRACPRPTAGAQP